MRNDREYRQARRRLANCRFKFNASRVTGKTMLPNIRYNEEYSYKAVMDFVANHCGFNNNEYFKFNQLEYAGDFENGPWDKRQRHIRTHFELFELNFLTPILYHHRYRKQHVICNTITASDIAQYTFCPVSFAIHKSFELPKSHQAEIGKILHESLRVTNYKNFAPTVVGQHNHDIFFNLVNHSKLVYAGHGNNAQTFNNKNFYAKPDYIFRSQDNRHYIVEEKYTHRLNSSWLRDYSHSSHDMQVAAYLYGIKEFELAKGYVVNWVYDTDDIDNSREPKIHECKVYEVERSNNLREKLVDKYYSIKKLLTAKEQPFNERHLNTNKCNNCSVAGICTHKYGGRSSVIIPYEIELPTSSIEMPNNLRSFTKEITEFLDEKIRCEICKKRYSATELSECMVATRLTNKRKTPHHRNSNEICYRAIRNWRIIDESNKNVDLSEWIIKKILFVCSECYNKKQITQDIQISHDVYYNYIQNKGQP